MIPEPVSAFPEESAAQTEAALVRELVAVTANRATPAEWFERAFVLLARVTRFDTGFALEFSADAPHLNVLAKYNLPRTFHTDLETFELPADFIAALDTPNSATQLDMPLAQLREMLRARHYGAPMFVPLTADGHALGVLVLLGNPHPETQENSAAQNASAQALLTHAGYLLGAALRRARLEKQLEHIRSRYDAFVTNGLEALWETDADFNLVYVNQAALDLIGLSWEQIQGHNLKLPLLNRAALPPPDRAVLDRFLETLLWDGAVVDFRVPAMGPEGLVTLSVNARVLRDEQGKMTGVQGSARNVTLHVKARRELEQRTRELEWLYELALRLNRTLDSRQALTDVLELIAKLLDADAVALGLVDERAGVFHLVAQHGAEDELMQRYAVAPVDRAAFQPAFNAGSANNVIEYLIATQDVVTTQKFLDMPQFDLRAAKELGYESFLGFSMKFENRVYGIVFLASKQPAHFDAHGARLGASISAQLGLALHTHHVLEESKHSAMYAAALSQIGRKIQYAPRADKVLNMVARNIKTALGVDYVVIQLLRPNQFEVVTASDPRETQKFHRIANYEQRILEDTEPLRVDDCDAPSVDAEQRAILKQLGLRASISMRLYAHDHPLGILFVNREAPYAWDAEQVEFVQRAAQLIAYALENKRLLDEKSKQLQIQRALENAGRLIASVVEPANALHAVADELARVFEVDYVGFHLLEKETLVLAAESGATGAPRRLPIAPHQHLIVRELETMVVRNRLTENVPLTQNEVLAQYGFLADIGAPMVVGNTTLGILYLSARAPRGWTDNEIRLAETFAQQIAVALEHARLFRESREQARDLRVLTRSAELIVSSRSSADVLPFIAAEFRRVLNADYVGFHLVEGNMLRIVTEASSRFAGETYPMSNYHHLILEHGQTIVVTDTEVDARDPEHLYNLKRAGCRADIGTGMVSRNKALGILFVSQIQPRYWTDSEIQLVRSFAQQIAGVLDLVKVLGEQEARVRELGLLTELQELAAMNLEEAALEDAAMLALRNFLNADAVGLSLLQDDHLKPLRVSNGPSYGEPMPLTPTSKQIFDTKQAVVFDAANLSSLDAEARARFAFYGIRTLVTAPMVTASGPVGLLSLLFKSERVITNAEKRFTQTVANQLAMAFANARYLAQRQQRIERSAKLTDFGFFCNSMPDSMTLQKQVVMRVCDMLDIQAASVRLVEDGWLTTGASWGYHNVSAREHPIRIDGPLAQILQAKKSFPISDLTQMTTLPAHWRERHLQEGFYAGLIVPMIVANQVTGVLTLFHNKPHDWQALETQYAETISNILALALANLQAREKIAQQSRELQATMDSVFTGVLTTDAAGVIRMWNREAEKITGYLASVMLGKRWDVEGPRVGTARRDDTLILEAMEDRRARFGMASRFFTRADGQVVSLREVATPLLDAGQNVRGAVVAFWDLGQEQEAERQKLDFINEMAHQLKTKLSVVVMSAQRVVREDLPKDHRAQFAQVLEGTVQDLQAYQERLTAFELEHGLKASEEQQVRLRSVVDEQVALFKVREPERHFHVEGDFDLVLADPERLKVVLENLLDNACKYASPKSRISIVARCPAPDQLVLKIHNKGAPIPQELVPHIFDRGQRGVHNVPGSGLGLWLARAKAREMGGDITCESEPKQGTTFEITLRRKTHALPDEADNAGAPAKQ